MLGTTPLVVLGAFATDFIVVGVAGGYLKKREHITDAGLTSVAFSLYTLSGCVAVKTGSPPIVVGGIVAAMDAAIWACTGGLSSETARIEDRAASILAVILVGFGLGGVLGYVGGGVASLVFHLN